MFVSIDFEPNVRMGLTVEVESLEQAEQLAEAIDNDLDWQKEHIIPALVEVIADDYATHVGIQEYGEIPGEGSVDYTAADVKNLLAELNAE